jgi:regulator of RNase E activity RraA
MRTAADARAVSTALLASAGKGRVSVIMGLEPAWAGTYALGRAFTARGSRGDNLVGTSPRGPAKRVPGELGTVVELMGVAAHTGDLICADDDGVVVVPSADAEFVVQEAADLATRELEFERRIAGGESTVTIFDLPGQPA